MRICDKPIETNRRKQIHDRPSYTVRLHIELGIMDSEKESIGRKRERNTAGAARGVKINDGRRDSVFVLSEMEASERVGRVCRALKYNPKRVQRPSAEQMCDLTADQVVKGTEEGEEASNERHVCGISELESHPKDHKIRRKGCRLEKNHGIEREVQTSSDQTDRRPESSNHETEFPQKKKYTCYLCGMEYVRKPRLVSHMRIHTGETPYTCKECGRGFRRSDWLAGHMEMHKDKRYRDQRPKQFTCDVCDKKFRSHSHLVHHKRRHTGVRPYSCAICQMCFYSNSCLKKHLVTHSDDRPHTCSECGHGFKLLQTLKKHMRIHTGEKPYTCSFCGRKFAYTYALSMHMKSSRCKRPQATKST